MRKLLIITAIIGLAALGLQAQTGVPTPPADNGSFLGTVQSYFTAFNTNLDNTFGASKGSIWTGVDSIQGGTVSLANSIGVSYNLYKMVSAEGVIRNGGVTGTILSYQGGLGFNFLVHDVRLTAYADGGYGTSGKDRTYGELGLRAQKALTEHTYAWVGVGAQLPANRQIFSAGVGFTF